MGKLFIRRFRRFPQIIIYYTLPFRFYNDEEQLDGQTVSITLLFTAFNFLGNLCNLRIVI